MMGFNIENLTAKQALMDAKEKHARRWQTKEGTYRLKEKLLPDVRDTDVERLTALLLTNRLITVNQPVVRSMVAE